MFVNKHFLDALRLLSPNLCIYYCTNENVSMYTYKIHCLLLSIIAYIVPKYRLDSLIWGQ